MAQYRYFSEGQLKVDPTTGTKCRTGQLNHQFVEQKFSGGVWVGIGDNDGVRYGDVAGAGCRFREGMRDGDYAVDVETEVAGFLLAEGDGWVNCGGASGYWMPSKQLAGESVNFWAKGRNGLTMPDSVGSDDVSILTPTFTSRDGALKTGAKGILERVFDGSNYTLYCKVKRLGVMVGQNKLLKFGSDGWIYRGILLSLYNEQLSLICGDNVVTLDSTLIADMSVTFGTSWIEIFLEVNSITKVLSVSFYNNDTGAIIGVKKNMNIASLVFNNDDNQSDFVVSTGMLNFAFAELKKFNALKTIAQCRNNAYATDLQLYYPTIFDGTDVSGNGHHLTTIGAGRFHKYYSNVSTYLLDNGYSLYRSVNKKYPSMWPDNTGSYDDVYIPNSIMGMSIARTIIDANADTLLLVEEHVGSLTEHNYAESLLNISGDNWDKSDTAIYQDDVRLIPVNGGALYYDALNSNRWHIAEFDYLTFSQRCKSGYEGLNFFKSTDNSLFSKKFLKEIFGFNVNKNQSDIQKILQYTGDKQALALGLQLYTNTEINNQFIFSVIGINDTDSIQAYFGDGKKQELTIMDGVTEQLFNHTYIDTIVRKVYIFNPQNILLFKSVNGDTIASSITPLNNNIAEFDKAINMTSFQVDTNNEIWGGSTDGWNKSIKSIILLCGKNVTGDVGLFTVLERIIFNSAVHGTLANTLKVISFTAADAGDPDILIDITEMDNIESVDVQWCTKPRLIGDVTGKLHLKQICYGELPLYSKLYGDLSTCPEMTYLEHGNSESYMTGDISGLVKLYNWSTYNDDCAFTGSIANLSLLEQFSAYNPLSSFTKPTTVINNPLLCQLGSIIGWEPLTNVETNQILADLWTNRNSTGRKRLQRTIYLNGTPTGQGLTDLAALRAYRSPNNDAQYSLWTIEVNE